MRPRVSVVAVAAAVLFALTAVPVARNQAPQRPSDWRVRPDTPGADETAISFVDMRPGWHITTTPAVVLYRDHFGASGDFTIESELFLFPKGQGPAGVIAGGAGLDGRTPRYIALLVRGDGQFTVEERTGDRARLVAEWAAAPSLARPSETPARNVLRVRAIADEIVFEINDVKVASQPRSSLRIDGLVGLRAGPDANIHVTSLSIRLGGR
jgi:hypothetical protein